MIQPNFEKFPDGLVPAIVQDSNTGQVLMLGYMSQKSLEVTLETQKVTFYSRQKQRLWMKGEESANYLKLIDIKLDCDRDAILVKAIPTGSVCHKGTHNCWGEELSDSPSVLGQLQHIIALRKTQRPKDSYTTTLFDRGVPFICQKVGEEAIELILEAKDSNSKRFIEEGADLLYHLLVLFKAKELSLRDVEMELIKRMTDNQ